MTKTAPFLLSLFTTSVLCSSGVAYAGQTSQSAQTAPAASTTSVTSSTSSTSTPSPTSTAAPVSADGTPLPVSMDRIKKALTAPEPTGPPIRREITEGETPLFVVKTEAPRTLVLRSYLDDGTAVPGYVRPMFDSYHNEFLEMTTPDTYKGCGQYAHDQSACASMMSSRAATGLVWQQFISRGVDNVLRGLFKQ